MNKNQDKIHRFEVTLTRDGTSERVDTFTWGFTRNQACIRVTQMLDQNPEHWEGWSFAVAQEPTN